MNLEFGMEEFLDYENCKHRKRLIDKVLEEFSEDINESKMIYVTLNHHGRVWKSCKIYIILIITSIIIMGTNSACIYFYWHLIKNYFDKLPY